MCLVVSVRSPVLGPLGRGPVAHASAGRDAHFVHFVGMERVEGDLCLISTHLNGGYLICWNQGDTTENSFPTQSEIQLRRSHKAQLPPHGLHASSWLCPVQSHANQEKLELKTGQS